MHKNHHNLKFVKNLPDIIHVSHPKLDSYPIYIESGLFEKNIFEKIILKIEEISKFLIITDNHVKQLYGKKLNEIMKKNGKNCKIISFRAGESSKTLETFIELHSKINLELDRKSCILLIGGGVVGDMGGFVASTYMRGINFIQIPTSLLAMVDASVGGKLAVNHLHGKNCVGLFKNPIKVLIDPKLLKTLSMPNWANGFAEIIKYAVIFPDPLLSLIEKYIEEKFLDEKFLDDNNWDLLNQIIKYSIQIKVKIVETDYYEKNLRKILNLGHTIGHALEEYFSYDLLLHGQAITLGIIANLFISYRRNYINLKLIKKMEMIFQKVKLKIRLSKLRLSIQISKIVELIKNDKKAENNIPQFILIKGLGNLSIENNISKNEIIEALNYIK
ncbi:3-dehydroquinate synthase [Candidatus Harpocratesius sp.]